MHKSFTTSLLEDLDTKLKTEYKKFWNYFCKENFKICWEYSIEMFQKKQHNVF